MERGYLIENAGNMRVVTTTAKEQHRLAVPSRGTLCLRSCLRIRLKFSILLTVLSVWVGLGRHGYPGCLGFQGRISQPWIGRFNPANGSVFELCVKKEFGGYLEWRTVWIVTKASFKCLKQGNCGTIRLCLRIKAAFKCQRNQCQP
jgi:hypothetical protein